MLGLRFSFVVAANVRYYVPEDLHELARAFPHAVNADIHTEDTRRVHTRGLLTCARARIRKHGVVHPFAPPRESSVWLGCARPIEVERTRETKREKERGGESRGRKESTNPEERDAKQVTLASFQDSAWLGYLHLPKFTGGQCLAHFYGSIIRVYVLTLCVELFCSWISVFFFSFFSDQFSSIFESLCRVS